MFTIPVDDLYVSYFHTDARFSAQRIDEDEEGLEGTTR